MRLHVTFDDTPEFETLTAMQSVCRGAAWTLTNTDLSERIGDCDEVITLLERIVELLEAAVIVEKKSFTGQVAPTVSGRSIQTIIVSA